MSSQVGGKMSDFGLQGKHIGGDMPMRNAFEKLGKKNTQSTPVTEKTIKENLGPATSVSTMRRNRGLLSNTGSETLG